MILLDTNVVIDARVSNSPHHGWAQEVIAEALSESGVGLNAIVLAELCVGQKDPKLIEDQLLAKGVKIIDVPAAAARICGEAYSQYRLARRKSGGGAAPTIPLPDFFIGAHAELMGWSLATRDAERYRRYFPNVKLIEPRSIKR